MKREILVCDRCGAEAETKEAKDELALAKIHLGFELSTHYGQATRVNEASRLWRRDWCRKCRASLNILERRKMWDAAPAEIPSLEDMVREIVQEEMPQQ